MVTHPCFTAETVCISARPSSLSANPVFFTFSEPCMHVYTVPPLGTPSGYSWYPHSVLTGGTHGTRHCRCSRTSSANSTRASSAAWGTHMHTHAHKHARAHLHTLYTNTHTHTHTHRTHARTQYTLCHYEAAGTTSSTTVLSTGAHTRARTPARTPTHTH